MNIADIYWIEFPGGAGRAQSGRRPAIVIQAESVSAVLPTVLVVPLTTQLEALRFPGTFLIEPDAANRLAHPSVGLVFQLAAVDRRFVSATLGRLETPGLNQLWAALGSLIDRQITA